MLFQMFIISITLSIDALGIGMSYRLKGVRIPFFSKLVIALVSFVMMGFAILLGKYLTNLLPDTVARILGAGILMLIGIVMIRKSLFDKKEKTYDFDHSSKIDRLESVMLGLALSTDSLSAGIAIASLGVGNWMIALMVGLMQILFLYLGEWISDKVRGALSINERVCSIFSGLLLVIIAFLRLK